MYSGSMTVGEAARVLGVEPSATRAEVERAFRALAKQWHPDRFTEATSAQRDTATAQFALVTEALAVMDARRPVAAPAQLSARPLERPLLVAWGLAFAVGCALSVWGGPEPFGEIERAIRVILLGGSVVAFAVTAKRAWFTASVALIVLTIVLTLLSPAFGTLLALVVTLPSALALLTHGRRKATSA